jgi:preprotein translocase subunit SecY
MIVASIIVVWVIREITIENWGSGISMLLCFDSTVSILNVSINPFFKKTMENSDVGPFLKMDTFSLNLQGLFVYFGFFILISFISRLYTYLPYGTCDFKSLKIKSTNFESGCLPLRLNTVALGTSIFLLDTVLESGFELPFIFYILV